MFANIIKCYLTPLNTKGELSVGDKEQAEAPFSLKDGLTYFLNGVRHSKLLGMEIVEISESGLVVKLPYSEKIVGNPVTGVIHGGPSPV